MDVSRLQLLAIIVTAGLFILVFELVRQRRLLERYALLWLFASAVLLGALDLARRAGGARVGGRDLLRAVGAVRGRVRLRARAAAALLARDLAPGRADQGAGPAHRPAPARGRRAAQAASATPSRPRPEPGRAHLARVDARSRSSSSPTTRARDLPATLAALRPQLADGDELLVVDNASPDDPASVAAATRACCGWSATSASRAAATRARRRPRRRCCSSSTPTPSPPRAASTRCAPPPTRSPAGARGRRSCRWPAANEVNTRGGDVHLLGIGWVGRLRRAGGRGRPAHREVAFASGAALVVRRGAWDAVGGFDPDYFMYGEDLDLSLRLRLAGWGVGLVPRRGSSTTTSSPRATHKWFFLERNRWWTVLGAYPGRCCGAAARAAGRRAGAARRRRARRLAARRSCARRPPCCARCPGRCAGGGGAGGRDASARSEFAAALTAGARLALPRRAAAAIRPLAAAQAAYWRLVRRALAVHVGFDLLFLVPGADRRARDLRPRADARARCGAARPASSPRFVNRETAAAGPGFWTECAARGRAVARLRRRARIAGRWASSPRCRGRRAGVDVLHSPANFAPLNGAVRARADVHDVLCRRAARAPCRRRCGWGPIAARHRGRAARATGSSPVSHTAAADVARELQPAGGPHLGRAQRRDARRRRRRRGAAPTLGPGRAAARARGRDRPPAQEPRGAAGGPRADPAGPRPLLAFAGHGTDAGALRARAPSSASTTTCGCSARSDDLEALYAAAAPAHRDPLRGLRPAGARGDGPRRAGRVLGPAGAARGRRRRRRLPRPPRPRHDRPRDHGRRSAMSSACAGRPGAGGSGFTWAAAAARPPPSTSAPPEVRA